MPGLNSPTSQRSWCPFYRRVSGGSRSHLFKRQSQDLTQICMTYPVSHSAGTVWNPALCWALRHPAGNTDITPSQDLKPHASLRLPRARLALGKDDEDVAIYDHLLSLPYSPYLDPHPLATRIPLPGPHPESDPNGPSHRYVHFLGHESIKSGNGQLPFPHCGSPWTLEPEDSRTSCPPCAFADGEAGTKAMSPQAREHQGLLATIGSQEPSLPTPWFWTADLQNCEIISFYIKPPS